MIHWRANMEFYETVTPDHSRIRCVEAFNAHQSVASALVVIPTYNERENIVAILEALHAVSADVDAFVVDDGSPDGTADAVAVYAATLDRRIRLMRRTGKFGLGVAYLDAHRWIVEHLPEYQYVIQMDADFSHDPLMIPLLVQQAGAYGVAIGSRYVEGGAAPDWSRSRLFLSHAANSYVRSILRMFFPSYPVQDNTSGFIAWRRDVLEQVVQYPIPGDGYAFLTSLKLVAYRIGFPPKELPIILRDRRLGVSKLNRHIMFEAFKMPWKLWWTYRSKHSLDTLRLTTLVGEQSPGGLSHDNSAEMWDRYYASEDETGVFAKLVHWAREVYFGGLFARRVVELGGPASSYLELGVGTAQTLARLQKRTGARCVGIEKTPRAYELGKAYATTCELVLGDGLHLPFPDKSFDIVYSLGLLEHFEPAEQAQLLREQARVARRFVLAEVPTHAPHMHAILWFNRRVLGKRGVWADEELFNADHFKRKYPGMPFEYFFDWASGCMTCWFVIKSEDAAAYVASPTR